MDPNEFKTTPQPYREKTPSMTTSNLDNLKAQRAAELARQEKAKAKPATEPEPPANPLDFRTRDIKPVAAAIERLNALLLEEEAEYEWDQLVALTEDDDRADIQRWLESNEPEPEEED